MTEKHGALFSLEELVPKLDCNNTQFDRLRVAYYIYWDFLEVERALVQVRVQMDKFYHLLLDGAATAQIIHTSFACLGHLRVQVDLLEGNVLAAGQCVLEHIRDVGRVDLTLLRRI